MTDDYSRYMWAPGDVVMSPSVTSESSSDLTAIEADMDALVASILDESRFDDTGHGNPYHAGDGKFSSGGGGRRGSKVERAQGHVEKAAGHVGELTRRHGEAVASHRTALASSEAAVKEARRAAQTAKKSPTSENIKAWQTATNKAIRAKAASDKHGVTSERHSAALEKAHTTHALAQAKLHEAQRASVPTPTGPRSIEVHPNGVGFERVHGEGTTGAIEHSPTPEFHFGAGMGRIHGEGDHATVAPVHDPVPKPKESVLDMLSRTRPHYVHEAPAAKPYSAEAEKAKDQTRQADLQRERAAADAKLKEHRAVDLGMIPGVAAVSLPEARTMKRKG